jgi:hypothetical protein
VLLTIIGGVLVASSLETLQHRLRRQWFPESSLGVLAGLALVTLVAKVVIERQLEAESKELEAVRTTGADTDPSTGGLGL